MTWKPVYNHETWDEARRRWLAHLEDFGRRPWTLVAYGDEAERFGRWATARDLEIGEVRRADIEDYVSYLRRERGLAARSVAARLTALRGLFDWAMQHDLRPDNPARAVPNPRFRKALPKVMPTDEVRVLLDLPRRSGNSLKARRDDALLKTLAWTGLRVSEVARLDWDHFDLNPGRSTVLVVDAKGGKDRVVPVIEPLCRSLLSYLELRLPLGGKRAVWVGEGTDRLAVRTIREIVTNYGNRIGRHLTPHSLRRQCGVEMIRAGASLPEVRVVLGHAGYDTLLPYTALAADEARGALERIGQAASCESSSSRYASGSQQSDSVVGDGWSRWEAPAVS